MADKTPVRVVFNESNVATGMAEFQSGDTIPVSNGGTGLATIGSAGQIIKVNAAGNALEFGAEGDLSITNLVAPTNADLTLQTSGTGGIVLNDITISDNGISTNRSNDDFKINASGTGTVVLENLKIGTSGATVTTILDEDGFGSNSATSLATQQSIKAYVDTQLTAEDLDFQADSGGALSIDLDSETITFTGGTGIDTSGSGNAVTFAIDSTVTTLTGSQTLTNKIITTPTISGPTITGTATINAVTTNSISSNGSNADISIQPSGTGDVLISAIRVNGTTLDSSDSTKITIAENLDVTGTLTNASVAITGGSITGITDLVVADGGTGASTFTDGGVLLGSGTGAITAMAVLADGEMIVGDGTTDPVAESGATLRTSIGVGTGDSPQFTGIELGHATDTTITRASSGDLNIEGNLVYRAGGTDVPVADGGTGASSLTADAVLTGNGTSAITAEGNLSFDGSTLAVTGAVTVSGDLTVSGQTTTVATTNTTIADNILELNTGISQSLNDAGFIIERGSTGDNAAIVWDESEDEFILGTTTATAGNKSGGISVSAGKLKVATIEATTAAITGGSITGITDLTVADGGTGASTFTDGGVLLGSGTGAITAMAVLANGEMIVGDGTTDPVAESGATLRTSIGVGTGDSPQFTGIELGHATDTTITRASSGDLNIEGNLVYRAGGTDVPVADGGTGASSLTDNAVLTGTGTSAITAEGNLSFNGSTLAVTGAATVSTTLGVTGASTLDGVTVTDNTISTNASNSNLEISANGSGKISLSGLLFPTSDGVNGQALITDGSGTLSFSTVTESASDDTGAIVVTDKRITTTARTIDAFNETWQDSVLYYVVTNDHHLDLVNIEKINLSHNDTGPFVAHGGVQTGTGSMNTYSYESSNNIIRLKAVSQNALGANVSFYKIGLGDNSQAGTTGNIITTINADVDSASESLVSFDHATFRGAKLFVSVNNASKTEVSSFEAFVIHDGTTAYVSQGNVVNTGENDLAVLTAAIDGDNVVISAAGLEPNLRISVHALMLKDTMTANAGNFSNAEAIAPVTITSAATEFDTLEEKTTNGAVYFLVSKNDTEGHYGINEIMVAVGSNDVTHTSTGFISTKGTNQLEITTGFKDDTELQAAINLASTSGSSTTVSAYMIKLHAS